MTEPARSAETEAKREVVRRAFDAWQHGSGAITDVFAPEMVWRIEGHSFASKAYPNRQAFIDEVRAALLMITSTRSAAVATSSANPTTSASRA